ncbi:MULTISPECIES: aminoglycoside phosphotransferase family protein [Streptomyces]|uniref:Aminoglycoside phosphotransferase family protein n=1 Tax=Streptomyces kasugaensis TaxID=1946 RepID=A0A4Q9I115_STRKA|nr:aminoglycoside phosphotransferase family protein [Streptomyces kasugaensis]TBO61292.1 aminoglycoside phosphotransferase family protein [Streptomyces kasugaensis]
MTENKPFPPGLRAWVADNLPGLDEVTDVSWPRGSSQVWRVAAGPTAAFVKLSPTEIDYDREVLGYAYTARILADHEAPRLLAADPGLKAIMSSPLPGKVVRGLPLEKEVELRVHEDAGRLLCRWHDQSDPGSEQDRQDLRTAMREQAQEAAACLESTAEYLSAEQRTLVEAVSRELPELAEQLPLVYQHGDYSTRNWLWDAESGHHGLIDFAMAHHGPAVEEFVWLCGAVWATRPDLKAAYFAGYGRPLSNAEERLLRLLTTRLGVSYLNSGLVKARVDLVERGHLVLDRMAHEYR